MRFDYYKLAKILKDRRNQLKLTIRDIEDLIDVSHSEISRIENGFKPKIDVVTLIKLCEILDLDFVNLLKETNYLVGKNFRKRGMESMKKFKVLVQKSKQIEMEVGAESELKKLKMIMKKSRKNLQKKLMKNVVKIAHIFVQNVEDVYFKNRLSSRKVCPSQH